MPNEYNDRNIEYANISELMRVRQPDGANSVQGKIEIGISAFDGSSNGPRISAILSAAVDESATFPDAERALLIALHNLLGRLSEVQVPELIQLADLERSA